MADKIDNSQKYSHVAGILLAAGNSTRMGKQNKLLCDYQGKKLIHHACEALQESQLAFKSIVLGYQSQIIQAEITKIDKQMNLIFAPDWQQGMGHSLKAALQMMPANIEGALIMLSDMPLITPQDINKLATHFQPDYFTVPRYQGKIGNPIIIPKKFFSALTNIQQKTFHDQGARNLIAKHADSVIYVEFANNRILKDIDDADMLKNF